MNVVDSEYNENALIRAVRFSNTVFVRLLLQHSIDVYPINIFGESALYTAACQGQDECVSMIAVQEYTSSLTL